MRAQLQEVIRATWPDAAVGAGQTHATLDALRHAANIDVVHVLQIAGGQKAAQNRARHRVDVRQVFRVAAVGS